VETRPRRFGASAGGVRSRLVDATAPIYFFDYKMIYGSDLDADGLPSSGKKKKSSGRELTDAIAIAVGACLAALGVRDFRALWRVECLPGRHGKMPSDALVSKNGPPNARAVDGRRRSQVALAFALGVFCCRRRAKQAPAPPEVVGVELADVPRPRGTGARFPDAASLPRRASRA